MNRPAIPFLNLRAAHDPIRAERLQAIGEVIDSNAFAGGPFVAKFETEFAAFCGASHCVASGNGTDALWLPLLALGVGPGDEVITSPFSFISSANCALHAGADVAFADIDPRTFNLEIGRAHV